MPITSKDGFKGNSDTTTKLATPRSINGTNFDGTANISTANWGTTRTLTIGNTGKSVNGSGNVAWSLSEIGASPSNHTHSSLNVADTRNVNTTPSALDSIFSVDFKNRSTINNAPGTGTYNGLLQFAPWNDTTGGNGYQMSYGYSGTIPYLGIRTADLNSSSWGSWYEIYHSGRKPSKSDVGLSNVQNWSATSATNDSSTSKYATAAGVKAAYDKANSAYNLAQANKSSTQTYDSNTYTLQPNETIYIFNGNKAGHTKLKVKIEDTVQEKQCVSSMYISWSSMGLPSDFAYKDLIFQGDNNVFKVMSSPDMLGAHNYDIILAYDHFYYSKTMAAFFLKNTSGTTKRFTFYLSENVGFSVVDSKENIPSGLSINYSAFNDAGIIF